jgi:small subunit ribosomal protein S6
MNQYEALYILRADLGDEAVDAQTAKYAKVVTDAKGEVEKIDKWGVKKLAYPIDFKTEGCYVLMTFAAPGTLPVEIERQMKIADEVIRYLIVRKDGKAAVKPVKPAKPAKPVKPPEAAEKPIEKEEDKNDE